MEAPRPQATLTPCEVVRAEIAKHPGWDVNVMTAVAISENDTCDPTRHNLTSAETHIGYDGRVVCVGSYGALQVGCVHYESHEDRNDLATNVAVAHRVWQSQGYNAWTEFRNGRYKRYLE